MIERKGFQSAAAYVSLVHESRETPFVATLTAAQRRLAGRLSGFGDIVFGFAISQCALQLPTSGGHVDLLHPFGVLLYFATFTLIASLWMVFHQLTSGAFVPAGIDLIGAFSYLALVSLFPFAMYATTHTASAGSTGVSAFAEYATLYAVLMVIAACLTLRNLRRGWQQTDALERDDLWAAFVRRCVVAVEMALATAIDFIGGATFGSLFLCTLPVAIRVARLRFAHAPRRFGAGAAASTSAKPGQ